jgi:hypothetical protein
VQVTVAETNDRHETSLPELTRVIEDPYHTATSSGAKRSIIAGTAVLPFFTKLFLPRRRPSLASTSSTATNSPWPGQEDLVSCYNWWRGYTRFSAVTRPWVNFDVDDEVAVLQWLPEWVLWQTHPFEGWWGPTWFVAPVDS